MKSKHPFDIIVTLNPDNMQKEYLRKLIDLGVTIFRVNGSFLLTSGVEDMVARIKESCHDEVKILLDLPGFKPRFSHLEKEINYVADKKVTILLSSINYAEMITHMTKGDYIRIKDGRVRMKIDALSKETVTFVPNRSGSLRRGKGFYLEKSGYRPSSHCLSQIDQDLIEVAKKIEIDFVGLSFVHNIADIEEAKRLLENSKTDFIPKIEARESLEYNNLVDILKTCKKVIVDRGDMSGEVGIENIWRYQRKILDLAKILDCNVIMATQFFINMVNSPLPTIAEADSFYDLLNFGIDGIQLSEETCVGHYGYDVVQFINENLSKYQRAEFKNGVVIWIMGPTSAGKTTLAKAFVNTIKKSKVPVYHLDGDEIRSSFGSQHSFSADARLQVVKNIVHHANKMAKEGHNVIVSALTAHEDARAFVHAHIEDLTIVYLDCPIEECVRRDPKGLYAESLNGKVDTVIGLNSKYNPPGKIDISIDTNKLSVEACVDLLVNYVLKNKKIRLWN